VTTEDRSRASTPVPGAIKVARILLRIESAVGIVLGMLLIVGGLIVLSGGSGLPGIVNDPTGDPPIGGWVVGVGVLVAVVAIWGTWTGWSMRHLTRGAFISALLFCGALIVLGLIWISIATSLIPGTITITLNGVILVGLAGPASSRAAFRIAPPGQGT
jgi:hypothetical protein